MADRTKSDGLGQTTKATKFNERRGTELNKPNTIQNIKSLHVTARKNELNRIEKENTKIALKIFFA